MFHPTLYLILGLAICNVGLCSRTETQVAQEAKSLVGSISGKVTVHGKGRAGIVVGLRSADPGFQPGPLLKATSDEDGNYRLGGVNPGRWLVIPIAPAFVVANHSFGSPGKMILVAAGESIDSIDFALVGGGVITGRVTDLDGRPLIEERITLIQADSPKSGVTSAYTDELRTSQPDDRGVYRIFGLAASRYKL